MARLPLQCPDRMISRALTNWVSLFIISEENILLSLFFIIFIEITVCKQYRPSPDVAFVASDLGQPCLFLF